MGSSPVELDLLCTMSNLPQTHSRSSVFSKSIYPCAGKETQSSNPCVPRPRPRRALRAATKSHGFLLRSLPASTSLRCSRSLASCAACVLLRFAQDSGAFSAQTSDGCPKFEFRRLKRTASGATLEGAKPPEAPAPLRACPSHAATPHVPAPGAFASHAEPRLPAPRRVRARAPPGAAPRPAPSPTGASHTTKQFGRW
jgi:hypothetical protein